MSFVRRSVEDALIAFASHAWPGATWILANQVGDRPPIPYGTISVSSVDEIGMGEPEVLDAGIQITERMRGVFELQASIQTYGSQAMDMLSALETHAKRPSVSIGIPDLVWLGFLEASEYRSLSTVISADREGRAQADFRFSARFDADLLVDTIWSVAISGAERTLLVEVPE